MINERMILLGGMVFLLLFLTVDCAKRSMPEGETPLITPETHHALGKQHLVQRNFQEAAQQFQRALALDPGYVPAYEGLGLVHLEQGDLQEAHRNFQKGLEKNPHYAPIYIGLGRICSARADDQEAVIKFRQALELDPGNADAFYHLGKSYTNLGQYSQAEESFKKALDNEPSHTPASEAWAMLARMRTPPGELPPEYAAIAKKPIVTRSDFAALLAHYLPLAELCGSEKQDVTILDIESSWARAEIHQVVSCGLMATFPDEQFKPRQRITRLQCAQVVSEVLQRIPGGLQLEGQLAAQQSPYSDVPTDAEAFQTVFWATQSGSMNARSDGSFGPDEGINGYRATKIVRALRDRL
jgi:Tfp pilus assembly protein PilF